jgi:hypothetical protein
VNALRSRASRLAAFEVLLGTVAFAVLGSVEADPGAVASVPDPVLVLIPHDAR